MSAVLFGSISTIADTSELQRESFNRAFAAHGLDWRWDREDYLSMLESSGGANRIADYAQSRGEDVDAAAVHRTKSEYFRTSLAAADLTPRDGVVETVRAAKENGARVALVTTTSPDNVASLVDALDPALRRADFDLIVDATTVDEPKPDAAAYRYALDALGESADGCVAIEDNVGGVESAVASGVTCVAFPNENTAGHSFDRATRRVDRLDFDELRGLAGH